MNVNEERRRKFQNLHVAVSTISSKLPMLKNMEMEKVNEVMKPMTTVPMMPIGMSFSGW